MIAAQVITIGDEILIGQIVDTNSAFISQKLDEAGIHVTRQITVGDSEKEIISAVDAAFKISNVIIVTGGLGPTKDDITKTTLAKYFDSALRLDDASYQNVVALFKSRGKEVSEANRKQAEVPENCTAILNKRGTAPGMWFERNSSVLVSLPGVPQEMKAMLEENVIPKLKTKFILPVIFHRNILTQGIGESALAVLIEEWENKLPQDIKLAYLPSTGVVRLRLSSLGESREEVKRRVESEVKRLKEIAGNFIYGYDEDTLEKIIGTLLLNKNKTICTAESCTGGYIAHRLTSVSGSSGYFLGSVVAYANEVKENFLNVPDSIIKKHGAVSEEVVKLMAENARNIFGADYSVACSGIAGPDGGTKEKPVGTVWIAIAALETIKTKLLQLGKGRMKVIEETNLNVLNMLRNELLM